MEKYNLNETIAVDFGTCNSCIAYWNQDHVDIVSQPGAKNHLFPTCIQIDAEGLRFGHDAFRYKGTRPNVVYEIKRIIGRSYSDPVTQECKKNWKFKLTNVEDDPEMSDKPFVSIPFQEEDGLKDYLYTAEDIYSQIIYYFKQTAEEALGREIKNVVVTVPAYFTSIQKEATRESFCSCDLEVIDVVNEPTAAAIAYCNCVQITNETVFVYDLGGGTFDVTILRVKQNDYEVLGTGGDSKLGGMDFTNCVVELITEKINEYTGDYSFDYSKYYSKLYNVAEKAKIDLSESEYTTIQVDDINDDWDGIEIEITLDEFNMRCQDLFTRTRNKVEECLRQAHLSPNDINRVILIGGSSRMKQIEEMLGEMFNTQPIMRNINPDEAVAEGALIYAAIRMGVQPSANNVNPYDKPIRNQMVATPSLSLYSAFENSELNRATGLSIPPAPPIPEVTSVPKPIELTYASQQQPSIVSNNPAEQYQYQSNNNGYPPMNNSPSTGDIVIDDCATISSDNIILDNIESSQIVNIPPKFDGTQSFYPPQSIVDPVASHLLNTLSSQSDSLTPSIHITDRTRKSFVMQQPHDTCIVLFASGDPIPDKRFYTFETIEDYASYININIAEGNEPVFSQNEMYARIKISNIPMLPRGQVQVSFEIFVDNAGIASFKARTIGNHLCPSKEATVNIINPLRVNEQNVAQIRQKREDMNSQIEENNLKKERSNFYKQFIKYREKMEEQRDSPMYSQLKKVEDEMNNRLVDQNHTSKDFIKWREELIAQLVKCGYSRQEIICD